MPSGVKALLEWLLVYLQDDSYFRDDKDGVRSCKKEKKKKKEVLM